MEVVRLFPNIRYLAKIIVSALLSLLPVSGFFLFAGLQTFAVTGVFTAIIGVMIVVVLLLIIGSYLHFSSIHYEIHDDEIIVYSGFLSKSVKHVNFRNVTNMELKRTLFDRILGIGSLSIQTAGSGSVVPEEKLAGLDNVQEVYQFIAQQLRDYRTDARGSNPANSANTLNERNISIQILRELRMIRTLLSQ